MTGLSNCRDRFGGKLLEVKTGVFCFSKGPGYSVGWFDFMVSGMVLTNFNGSGVGFGFGVGCGFGIGWGFGGKSLQTLGLGVGGGCGIGLGLGWGFGTAYGTHYVDSTIMFEGIDFEKAKTPRNKSGDLSKPSQDQAE